MLAKNQKPLLRGIRQIYSILITFFPEIVGQRWVYDPDLHDQHIQGYRMRLKQCTLLQLRFPLSKYKLRFMQLAANVSEAGLENQTVSWQ